MNPQVKELLQSFETDSKTPKRKYNDFLAYVYVTFDKKISSSKADKIIDKYIKMRKLQSNRQLEWDCRLMGMVDGMIKRGSL
jgi:hypothetical protein